MPHGHPEPATAGSPYLNQPLRSEQQAAEDRDNAMIAGLLVAADALMLVAAKAQDRAASERGRLFCADVCDAVETIRRRALLAGAPR